jgi:hypothetical protein
MPIPLGIIAVAGAGAAGGGGSFDLLETVTIGTTTASVTFSGLGSYTNYKHLQIRAAVRINAGVVQTAGPVVQLNSDTGSNYARHNLSGDGSSVVSTAQTGTSGFYGLISAGANAGANIFGVAVIDILDFSSSNKNTTLRSLTGVAASESRIALRSALWNNTAAVTSITFADADILAGSRFSLYGYK